jgi:hypothetical protein
MKKPPRAPREAARDDAAPAAPSRDAAAAAAEHADPRFAAVHSNPRFARFPKARALALTEAQRCARKHCS